MNWQQIFYLVNTCECNGIQKKGIQGGFGSSVVDWITPAYVTSPASFPVEVNEVQYDL